MAKRKAGKPGKGKFRNVRIRYVLVSVKTNRQISKARAKRYPRIKTKRVRRYWSLVKNTWIKPEKIHYDPSIQALLEFHDKPLSKKQLAHWRYILDSERTRANYRQQASNYQRWYLAIYKENPALLPPKLQKHCEEEQARREIGGSEPGED